MCVCVYACMCVCCVYDYTSRGWLPSVCVYRLSACALVFVLSLRVLRLRASSGKSMPEVVRSSFGRIVGIGSP
jgi:hypothetical protein